MTGTSPDVTVTVANPGLADLANSSFTFTPSVGGRGCGIVHLTFDAVYPGSAAVGNVTLHIAGLRLRSLCVRRDLHHCDRALAR